LKKIQEPNLSLFIPLYVYIHVARQFREHIPKMKEDILILMSAYRNNFAIDDVPLHELSKRKHPLRFEDV